MSNHDDPLSHVPKPSLHLLESHGSISLYIGHPVSTHVSTNPSLSTQLSTLSCLYIFFLSFILFWPPLRVHFHGRLTTCFVNISMPFIQYIVEMCTVYGPSSRFGDAPQTGSNTLSPKIFKNLNIHCLRPLHPHNLTLRPNNLWMTFLPNYICPPFPSKTMINHWAFWRGCLTSLNSTHQIKTSPHTL